MIDTTWDLPGPQRWIAQTIDRVRATGMVIVATDVSTPSAPAERFLEVLGEREDCRSLVATGDSPVSAARAAFSADAPDLVSRDQVFIVDAVTVEASCVSQWYTFATRMREAWACHDDPRGGLILVVRANAASTALSSSVQEWSGTIRPADAMIWAEAHMPYAFNDAAIELAAAVLQHLCGWRLDVAEALAKSRFEILVDPRGWLEACALPPGGHAAYAGTEFACPISLRDMGDWTQIERRIWRAQLGVLFPRLEEHRQAIVERWRPLLSIDAMAQKLRVRSVDDLELGAVAWQLRSRIDVKEAERIRSLAVARNYLAHRDPLGLDVIQTILSVPP